MQYKDSTVVENYANSSKLQFTTKIITPKNDTAANVIIYEYDKNGFIMAKHGERAYLNNGLYWEYYPNGKVKTISEYKRQFQNFRLGIYQEYYPSGKLKLDAHIYKARRVGCWTWYYEDGTFWAEWDYFDGKAPQ